MRIINTIAAFITLALFFALLYTMPKAIIQFGVENVKYAVLNIFLMVWFMFLFKATTAGKGGEDNGR